MLGGVPEHFNLPWNLCIEEGLFKKEALDVSWQNFPEGTGAICKSLRNKELDAAVILTEGIVKDIIAGNKVKIVQEFVSSPLIWGIHVAANSPYKNLQDLRNAKVAISRYGSGSHLMAYVNAKNLGWDPQKLEFEIVNSIDGAVQALQEGRAGYFMWEHFMTKPLVDKGIFRRLGDCPTPWSSFVIVVREEFLKENQAAVQKMLSIINRTTSEFKNVPFIENLIASRFHQKKEDVSQWLNITSWSQNQISIMELDKVQEQLLELQLIPNKMDNLNLISDISLPLRKKIF